MTPKQKAYKLRYLISVALDLKTDDVKVLKCALITVDEILDFRNKLYINEGSIAHQYLLEVKQEIKKLWKQF
jgi:uracil-DNA glycosylase